MNSISQKAIRSDDLISLENYSNSRDEQRLKIVELKKSRRLPVGPDIVFHFENYATILFQIQEILYIEKGGNDQIEEELKAYNPLIPQGNALMMTMMIEIPDEATRKEKLQALGHIENMIVLQVNKEEITAQPVDNTQRTTDAGKTSAVHFLSFVFNEKQQQLFKDPFSHIILKITHPQYSYSAEFPSALKINLREDLA